MPRYQYRVEGVAGPSVTAFTPLPTTNGLASTWGVVKTVGAPGTLRIPVAPLQSIAGSDRGGWTAQAKPGDNAPDYILPSLYYTAPTPQTVPHESNNEIPLPAISSTGPIAPASTSLVGPAETSAVVQRPRRMGGLLAQAWPKVSQVWNVFGSGVNNSANSGQIT